MTRRVRLDAVVDVGVLWVLSSKRLQRVMAALRERFRTAVDELRYDTIAGRMFDEVADVDGSGTVNRVELYTLSLRLYLAITQILPQVNR